MLKTSIQNPKKERSPSQRLRDTLFLRWEREIGPQKMDFDSWYKLEMEHIINNEKNKL